MTKFIDLFCGLGGFHLALAKLGAKCVLACDIDAKVRKVYEDNHGTTPMSDIYTIPTSKIPKCDVLTGGFPCQSFSRAGVKGGFKDKRGNLFFEIIRFIKQSKPKVVLLENVKHLKNHNKGETWKVIREKLLDMDNKSYDLITDEPLLLNPLFFGTPQNRERVFILCVRKNVGVKIRNVLREYFIQNKLSKQKVKNIVSANAPKKYQISNQLNSVFGLWNEFLRILQKNKVEVPRYSMMPMEMAKNTSLTNVAASKKLVIKKNRDFYKKHSKILSGWLKKALKNTNFKGSLAMMDYHGKKLSSGKIIQLKDCYIQTRPSGVRVTEPKYFPTLVTFSSQVPIVGKYNRQLTPAECGKLQGFPANYSLKMNTNDSHSYKQFGNAVNVDCVSYVLEPVFKGIFKRK